MNIMCSHDHHSSNHLLPCAPDYCSSLKYHSIHLVKSAEQLLPQSTWSLMMSCLICAVIGCRELELVCVCVSECVSESLIVCTSVSELLVKMKMNVLVLCFVLSVSAEGLHEDLAITGCSDSDGEDAYNLDGEELWFADFINKKGVYPQPSFIDPITYVDGVYQQAEANQQVCKSNLDVIRRAMKDFKMENDPPSSLMIYTRDAVKLGGKNTLICHVTGFYPAPVHVYWTKNQENVTEGTSLNVPYPNEDGSFRQTARLDFIAQQGDFYTCTVSHPALDPSLTKFWEVKVQQPSVGPAVFCGVGLTAGLLGVAAGTFFLIKGNECS